MHNFKNTKKYPPDFRSGFGTSEMIISMILLGMLTTSIVPIFQKTGRIQKKYQQQLQLQQTAASFVEQIHTLSSEELEASEEIQKIAGEFGKSNEVQISVQSFPAKETSQPIRIQLEVKPVSNASGLNSVKLTTWVTRKEQQKEDS